MYRLLPIEPLAGWQGRGAHFPGGFAIVKSQPVSAAVPPTPGPPADVVAQLPPPGSPERWPWLQRLRRQTALPLEPWLQAVEGGHLVPQQDLMAVLADHLDGPAMARLLCWWLRSEPRDPALPPLIVPRRDPHGLAALRQACAGSGSDPERLVTLLPLVGHQRDPEDFSLLQGVSLKPGPLRIRQAALEGLCRGLGAWPLSDLRHTLLTLAGDLHPPLAAASVDALARLPEARPALLTLARQSLDPAVAARLERRLRRLSPTPLVLFVHGRSGGLLPPELVALAQELEERRGAPVILETLTGAEPPLLPSPPAGPTTLVPLFLLPGSHVRRDLPDRFRRWRAAGPVRVLPFLGAWPAWQASLAEEVRRLGASKGGASPLLVHHPVEGPLPQRYLTHLATVCGARCLAVPYPAAEAGGQPPEPLMPALPLALAASRLTDRFGDWLGSPLLARPELRTGLLQLLVGLP
ncbi:MAG: CbiX/SirB N-terminal domain-containing protein [Cyanobacteriota bacterium]|nr:CbiX/SirB N-terminal domain-containing protein [Cyanobacteriota bacterium]